MAEPLKNIYSQAFFEIFCENFQIVCSDFNKELFMSEILDSEWENRELKQRMRHISGVLKKHLASGYKESVEQLIKIAELFQTEEIKKRLLYVDLALMFIPDFIELYGVEHFEISVSAFEKITPFSSCEFAVRPFIIRYEQKMLDRMLCWTRHENEHIRRLASEGCRPRLPWAMALPDLKKDPAPILIILDNLKNDPSEYVRKSVANSLNDISKDNPSIIYNTAKNWIGKTKETDWIVKHACRSLLKEGNQKVLEIFGFGSVEDIDINNLLLATDIIKIGENLEFSLTLQNNSVKNEKIRLEYGIYYQKQNGTLSRKVFMISEKVYRPKSVTTVNRKQSFKQISTRKFHAGKHLLSIIINGIEVEEREFELIL